MSKAVLEFQLPEEQEEFEIASKASDYYAAIYNTEEFLRNALKYGEMPDEIATVYEEVQAFLRKEVNDRGLKGYWNS